MVGHGWSSHLDPCGIYGVVAYTNCVHKMITALGWTSISIVGHSMGTQVGCAYSGTFNEKIDKLALIEGMGPLVMPSDAAPKILRKLLKMMIHFKTK